MSNGNTFVFMLFFATIGELCGAPFCVPTSGWLCNLLYTASLPLYLYHLIFVPRHFLKNKGNSTPVKKNDHECSYKQ